MAQEGSGREPEGRVGGWVVGGAGRGEQSWSTRHARTGRTPGLGSAKYHAALPFPPHRHCVTDSRLHRAAHPPPYGRGESPGSARLVLRDSHGRWDGRDHGHDGPGPLQVIPISGWPARFGRPWSSPPESTANGVRWPYCTKLKAHTLTSFITITVLSGRLIRLWVPVAKAPGTSRRKTWRRDLQRLTRTRTLFELPSPRGIAPTIVADQPA
jgi:hypothetical protein